MAHLDKEKMTGFIEEADRQGLLYLMLGSIITSDNSDEENRIALTLAEDILPRIVETSFPDERKEYVRKFAEDAIGLNKRIMAKEEALKFIEDHIKYRYVRTIGRDGLYSRGLDPDKEYYVEPWVAREAVEIALKSRKRTKTPTSE